MYRFNLIYIYIYKCISVCFVCYMLPTQIPNPSLDPFDQEP